MQAVRQTDTQTYRHINRQACRSQYLYRVLSKYELMNELVNNELSEENKSFVCK